MFYGPSITAYIITELVRTNFLVNPLSILFYVIINLKYILLLVI